MDIEKRRAQKRAYYERNKERQAERDKKRQQEMFADPEKRAAYCERWRQYTRDNYEARLLASIKSKCKKYNIPFDLTIADIVIPTHCPKTGLQLVVHKERGKFYDTPSMDRIDPKGGYVKGNIQIVSLWYNVAKLNWEEDVFISMCHRVVELNGVCST